MISRFSFKNDLLACDVTSTVQLEALSKHCSQMCDVKRAMIEKIMISMAKLLKIWLSKDFCRGFEKNSFVYL